MHSEAVEVSCVACILPRAVSHVTCILPCAVSRVVCILPLVISLRMSVSTLMFDYRRIVTAPCGRKPELSEEGSSDLHVSQPVYVRVHRRIGKSEVDGHLVVGRWYGYVLNDLDSHVRVSEAFSGDQVPDEYRKPGKHKVYDNHDQEAKRSPATRVVCGGGMVIDLRIMCGINITSVPGVSVVLGIGAVPPDEFLDSAEHVDV